MEHCSFRGSVGTVAACLAFVNEIHARGFRLIDDKGQRGMDLAFLCRFDNGIRDG